MSDFDREAERERLREQFAEDEEDRQATERMSELLLQGATMTNRHCDACGNPIFRYDDQEFCPSCQQPAGEGEQQTEAEPDRTQEQPQEQPSQAQGRAEGQERDREQEQPGGTDQSVDGREPADGLTERGGPAETRTDPDPAGEQETRTTRREREPEPDRRQADATAGTGQSTPARSDERRPRQPASGGDLAAARQSLVRTTTRFAREAEESDDLGRAREYLAAAREAAEALAAVREAGR